MRSRGAGSASDSFPHQADGDLADSDLIVTPSNADRRMAGVVGRVVPEPLLRSDVDVSDLVRTEEMHHVRALDRPFGGIDGLYVLHQLVIGRRFPIGALEKLQMRPLIPNGAADEGETQLRQEVGEDKFRQYREQLDEIQESVRRNIKCTERLQIRVDYLQKEEKLKGVISPEIKLIFP